MDGDGLRQTPRTASSALITRRSQVQILPPPQRKCSSDPVRKQRLFPLDDRHPYSGRDRLQGPEREGTQARS